MMIKRFVAAAIAALSVCLAVPASATTSHPTTYIGYNAVGGFTSGPSWVRFWDMGVTWGGLEPQPGQWQWARLDAAMSRARTHNQHVILTLGYPPAWAVAAGVPSFYGLGTTAPPTHLSDWTAYVAAVAQRYGTRIAAYEIWNEANTTFYSGTKAQLLAMVESAYPVLHHYNSGVRVLSPAWCCTTGPQWLAYMLNHGGAKYFDVVAIHDYPAKPSDIGAFIESYRTVLKNHGVFKNIWTTEVGCYTRNGNPQCQYNNPAGIGAFGKALFHYIHLHNVRVALWYPEASVEPGAWIGFTHVQPYLPNSTTVTW